MIRNKKQSEMHCREVGVLKSEVILQNNKLIAVKLEISI